MPVLCMPGLESEQGQSHLLVLLPSASPAVNVNKIKDFGEAAKGEILLDQHAFKTARRLSHDNMEEKVPWVRPRPLVLPSPLVIPGSNSQEKYKQAVWKKQILQELFPRESPQEPDPELNKPIPPKLIPLGEGSPNSHPSEELLKQPDYSDKLKQMLVPHGLLGPGPEAMATVRSQLTPVGPHLLGPPPPSRGGYPFWNGPGEPMQGCPIYGGPGPAPGLYKRGQVAQGDNEPPSLPSFQGYGGGHFGGGPPNCSGVPGGGGMVGGGGHSSHEGPGQRGPHGHQPHDVPSHRGQYLRGPPPHEHCGHDSYGGGGHQGHDGGHSHGGDMSNRPLCRHFMMKGYCLYENNCAFYHPGVNGPPLP